MPAPLATLLRALAVWLLIMLGESAHGMARRFLFSPDVTFALRQVSVVVGILIVFGVTWISLPWLRLRSARAAAFVGALWMALTLGFEVALGRLMGFGWERTFAEYDLAHGGLMPLGLLAMGLTPWLVLRLQAAPRKLRKTP